MSSHIVVNSKILRPPITGVQRYLGALLEHLDHDVSRVSPSVIKSGAGGHLWEQLVLPLRSRGALLWSPSNSGPLLVRNQVLTVHDMVPLDHPEWLTSSFCAWYKFLFPRLIPRVRRVIAISEFTRSRILAHTNVDPERVVVIPNGVDERFSPRPLQESRMVIDKLGLPSRRYVLSVGSLEPRKNLGRVLEAWGEVYRELPDDVWLVLSGTAGKKLVFQDAGLGVIPPRVHFTGHVSDELLPALYSAAEAFIYMSVYEGFGLPPLEAMACGVPTMTGNLTAIPEVVGNGGALMVNPYDVRAIGNGIVQLVLDPALRGTLREAGLRRAADFSWRKTAQLSRNVLIDVAAAGEHRDVPM